MPAPSPLTPTLSPESRGEGVEFLPLPLAGEGRGEGLGSVAPPNEVCAALAARLRRETRGEVLFDAASRGRYATDASIYQIMPVGVFVPRDSADVKTTLDICRDL